MIAHDARHAEDLLNKKILFAVLAHTNEEALAAQIENIRHFNPNAGIVLYNGGTDPRFGQRLDVVKFPGSHPIKYGNLTPYFWEIMTWLEETGAEYEYLINLDHDVLFIRPGFEDFLDRIMAEHDVMGWDMVISQNPKDATLSCCEDMWKEWPAWKPFFKTGLFIRYLNSTQVYKHGIIRRMLQAVDQRDVQHRISGSRVFALEEMFFVTLALSLGAKIRDYPRDENWSSVSRFGHQQISMTEVTTIRRNPDYYWIHPVKESWLIRMNHWLLGREKKISVPPAKGKWVIPRKTAHKKKRRAIPLKSPKARTAPTARTARTAPTARTTRSAQTARTTRTNVQGKTKKMQSKRPKPKGVK